MPCDSVLAVPSELSKSHEAGEEGNGTTVIPPGEQAPERMRRNGKWEGVKIITMKACCKFKGRPRLRQSQHEEPGVSMQGSSVRGPGPDEWLSCAGRFGGYEA